MAQTFLCYAREDEAWVRELYEQLRALGFELWMDKVNLLPGQKWTLEIPKALQASTLVLVCLSQNSVAKVGYVQHEFKSALDTLEKIPDGMIHTIPVRLDACDVPMQFHELQWCDLFEDNGFEQLVQGIRVGLSQRQLLEPGVTPEEPQRSSFLKTPAEDREQAIRSHLRRSRCFNVALGGDFCMET